MTVSDPVPPSLTECVQQLRTRNAQLLRIVDALIAVTVEHEAGLALRRETKQLPEKVMQPLFFLLQAVGASTNTIVKLSDSVGMHTRDCYPIARSVVETAVNVCYIMAQGEEMAERAMRHTRQMAYRDMERESRIGDSIIKIMSSQRPDPLVEKGLEVELNEFTTKRGGEKNWIDDNIDTRIRVVGEKLGSDVLLHLHFARFAVYRHSSEILHGTVFGAMYFLGLVPSSSGKQGVSGAQESIASQHMSILLATLMALYAVVEAFHSSYGFSSAFERAKTVIDSLQEIPYFNEQSSQQSSPSDHQS
ncbi:MAG: hypothetical protein IPO91_04290 [Chloroflexi bacterium]|nr:hypothetical protein [Chloroflexota bacterium]